MIVIIRVVYFYAYGNLKKGDIGKENYAGLDFEKRWANSFLFSRDTDISQNCDFCFAGTS